MSAPDDRQPASAEAAAPRRVTALGGDGGRREEERQLAAERLLSIRIVDGETFALMCSPGDEIELALGFLRAEGWLDSLADVELVEPCEGGDSVRVRLRRPPEEPPAARRNLVMYASCGMCGREDALPYLATLDPLPPSPPYPLRACLEVADRLRRRQPLFRATGGSHAAALFDRTGEVVSIAEDIGRHAAFDKAVGRAMRQGIETAGLAGFLSGRSSLEMVAKAARARLGALVAVGAPTAAAVDLADRLALPLAGFVRPEGMTVYTHPDRFLS